MNRVSKKREPEFMKMLAKHASLNEDTGEIKFNNLYGNLCVNIGWKGSIIVVPYSHIVWFLKYGRWPKEGFVLDHINDDPLDNRPVNLQEMTEEQNQKKRRGRTVYRNYGRGKYGFGINVTLDKRDGRYYVQRYLSRGHGVGDLKTIRKGYGGFNTQAEAEQKVKELISEIKIMGLDYLPGYTNRKIEDKIELKIGAVYLRAKNVKKSSQRIRL